MGQIWRRKRMTTTSQGIQLSELLRRLEEGKNAVTVATSKMPNAGRVVVVRYPLLPCLKKARFPSPPVFLSFPTVERKMRFSYFLAPNILSSNAHHSSTDVFVRESVTASLLSFFPFNSKVSLGISPIFILKLLSSK